MFRLSGRLSSRAVRASSSSQLPRFAGSALSGSQFARLYSLLAKLETPNGHKYEQPTGLFINGETVKALSGKQFEVISPITEDKIADLEEAGPDDVDAAVAAAEAAHKIWSETDPYTRSRVINKMADIVEENKELFASVETWDNGKTLEFALGDVDSTVGCLRYYAGWADKILGDVVETDKDTFNYVRREPVGVCGMIIPWNFPLLMLAWKIAPALCCGNAFVLKTAESTPLSALLFAHLTKDIEGLPKGTVNILSGYGPAGACISAHPKIKKVAFTGSTATGRKVMEAAAKSNLKKVTLELGGKSPSIVFDDANLEEAVDSTLVGIYYNQGEVCCAGSRLLVQESIKDEFLKRLKAKVEKLVVGDPYSKDTQYGAQTNKLQFEKILGYIEKGKLEGAKILTGGNKIDGKGFFIEPTVFYDVKNDDTIAREEIFGPVLSVITFKDVEDAVRIANDSEYGLASGVHTTDLNRALYVSNKLRAGSVWVNKYNNLHWTMPFGGYGQSGIGRELGPEALKNYLEVKSVRIAGIESTLKK